MTIDVRKGLWARIGLAINHPNRQRITHPDFCDRRVVGQLRLLARQPEDDEQQVPNISYLSVRLLVNRETACSRSLRDPSTNSS